MSDKKIKWNAPIYESVGKAFDGLFESHGEKRQFVTAALAMFVFSSKEVQRAFVEAVRETESPFSEAPTIYEGLRTIYREGRLPTAVVDTKMPNKALSQQLAQEKRVEAELRGDSETPNPPNSGRKASKGRRKSG